MLSLRKLSSLIRNSTFGNGAPLGSLGAVGNRLESGDSNSKVPEKPKEPEKKLPRIDPRLEKWEVVPDHEEKLILERRKLMSETRIEVKETDVLSTFSGVPKEHIEGRRVRIYKPSKNNMQSGTYNTKKWRIEFENRERWENPLMGWASSGDPMSNISMNVYFTTAEDAARYCENQGYTYYIDDAYEPKHPLKKSYAANFAWNKRTRTGSK